MYSIPLQAGRNPNVFIIIKYVTNYAKATINASTTIKTNTIINASTIIKTNTTINASTIINANKNGSAGSARSACAKNTRCIGRISRELRSI